MKPIISKKISSNVVVEAIVGVLSKYEIRDRHNDEFTGIVNPRFVAVDIWEILTSPEASTCGCGEREACSECKEEE